MHGRYERTSGGTVALEEGWQLGGVGAQRASVVRDGETATARDGQRGRRPAWETAGDRETATAQDGNWNWGTWSKKSPFCPLAAQQTPRRQPFRCHCPSFQPVALAPNSPEPLDSTFSAAGAETRHGRCAVYVRFRPRCRRCLRRAQPAGSWEPRQVELLSAQQPSRDVETISGRNASTRQLDLFPYGKSLRWHRLVGVCFWSN